MQHGILILVQLIGIGTGVGFVSMMVLYFKTGPQKMGDRCMSSVVLVGVAAQYAGLLSTTHCSLVRSTVGIGLFLLANLLFWAARIAHGTRRPAAVFGQAVPDTVTLSGPYRIVRHPFYLAYVLAFLAASIVGNRWWMHFIVVTLFTLYNLAAAQEERLLLSSPHVGKQYADYRRRSWRWCPPAW